MKQYYYSNPKNSLILSFFRSVKFHAISQVSIRSRVRSTTKQLIEQTSCAIHRTQRSAGVGHRQSLYYRTAGRRPRSTRENFVRLKLQLPGVRVIIR